MARPGQDVAGAEDDVTAVRVGTQTQKASHVTGKDLFRDPQFPPDWSSLTYVYSGEDKYERTVFKRPTELVSRPVLVGVGGVCEESFPWQTWRGRAWFQAAALVVSLCVKILDKVIPGYRDAEQGFHHGYNGAFHLRLWRFGEWQEVVVDDCLPTLEGRLLFCQALGSPPEFWAPLAEKAYAKGKKTFQAIEFGRTLDGLTDLTGALCEFYTPDVNPPERLFLVLFKSAQCRSLLVAWRNERRLTPAAFDWDDQQRAEGLPAQNPGDVHRYLHLITAVTKFPTTDGRTLEMIRLCCLFEKEPKWQGKFSSSNCKAWSCIKSEFMEKCRPLSSLEQGEYWITMEDFQCNFGGLIIASSEESLKPEALDIERKYEVEVSRHAQQNTSVSEQARATERNNHRRTSSLNERRGSKSKGHGKRHAPTLGASRPQVTPVETMGPIPAVAITVQEGHDTIVVDNTGQQQPDYHHDDKALRVKSEFVFGKVRQRSGSFEPGRGESVQHELFVRARLRSDSGPETTTARTLSECTRTQLLPGERGRASVGEVFATEGRFLQGGGLLSNTTTTTTTTISSSSSSRGEGGRGGMHGGEGGGGGVVTNAVLMSEGSYSTSEISLHFQTGVTFEERPRSAPLPGNARSQSRGSVCSLTHRHFRAPRADFFQSGGRWRMVLQHKDKWTKLRQACSRNSLDAHSRSPRFLFSVSKPEEGGCGGCGGPAQGYGGGGGEGGGICPSAQGTRHVLVSVLEDYRHGASTANSLVVPIGFCLYKAKNPDKDERRHISKLQFIGEVNGQPEMREVTSRFDLHPGHYFLVPYTIHSNHEGEFLIRVLAEGETSGDKAGCRIT